MGGGYGGGGTVGVVCKDGREKDNISDERGGQE